MLNIKVAIAIEVGAQQSNRYLPLLKGKRVGLIVNQSSRVEGEHLVDFLIENQVNVVRIFSPEHGFRGDQDAGAYIENSIDVKTGLPIVSLYGKQKRPTRDMLLDLDVLVFDIQDVGVRFYTYISTMHYMMQAAKEQQKAFIVLDRPNPNIQYVEGPVLDMAFRSFVGMHPIPILHGMTVGELAQMIEGEGWLTGPNKLNLNIIPVAQYDALDDYILPVAPSPNLPNQQAIYLYPSLCLFEATAVSIGRGTDFPFQVFGHHQVRLGEFSFVPRSIIGAARFPKLKGEHVWGQDLRENAQKGFDLTWFVAAYTAFEQQNQRFVTSPKFLDKLAGTNIIRLALKQGLKAHQIEAIWRQEVAEFEKKRVPYLLYKR
ncbi:exo-beta-N-acetylmuramidase NamZ family protein [Pseudoalteromonas luteoviolacea]|nr:DUF1343 domain-containing protein [Pseudoalteromonas luteoviolacea]AOT10175.1 hypothetical protein S4054249_05190 [Pseudoalteromonas luteoviolacea]AOT15088.1 hypothetical protein S40542_05190 [Pseudoalteromonas luteoviolacea]AOT20004.1 hypothetical protein S4054_05190 [Pseudoalteromonas luteoviolacea]